MNLPVEFPKLRNLWRTKRGPALAFKKASAQSKWVSYDQVKRLPQATARVNNTYLMFKQRKCSYLYSRHFNNKH